MKSNVIALRKDLPAPFEQAKTVEELFFDNQLINYAEAAKFLGIGERTLRRLKDERKVPFVPIGGQIRFRRSSLVQLVREREISR